MKKILIALFIMFSFFKTTQASYNQLVYDFSFKSIEGDQEIKLSDILPHHTVTERYKIVIVHSSRNIENVVKLGRDKLSEILKLICDRLSPQKNNRVILIKVGFIDENIVKKLKESFKSVSKDLEVIIADNLSQSNKSDFQFIICDYKKVLRSELLDINNKIVLQGNSLIGCFLIDKINA